MKYRIKFNGITREILVKTNAGDYMIKVSSDLNCADHRNDVAINGCNMGSGFGAIVSSKHDSLILAY